MEAIAMFPENQEILMKSALNSTGKKKWKWEIGVRL